MPLSYNKISSSSYLIIAYVESCRSRKHKLKAVGHVNINSVGKILI